MLCLDGNPALAMAANRLKALREAVPLTQERLAELIDASASDISRLESGQKKMTIDWMARLAPHLGVDARDLVADSPAPKVKPATPAVGIPASNPVAGSDRTLPIMGRAKGGTEGVLLISQDERPIDWTYRPPQLRDVPEAFAFFVTGDSMSPVYEPGDIGWVHPHQPPKRGKPVLVIRRDDEAILKIFDRQTPEWLTLGQYNPADQAVVIPAADVRRIYRVAGKWEGP